MGFPPSGGGGASYVLNVKTYGAAGNGSTNDTVAIQNAINAAGASSAGDGVVYFPAGTYLVGTSGSSIGGRPYSLLLPSNVVLKGDSSLTTTIRLANGQNCEVIRTGSSTYTNVGIVGLTVDGNDINQNYSGTRYMNIWFNKVTNVLMQDVRSINACNWACRVDTCTKVTINGYEANTTTLYTTHPNGDGLHFLDTSQVVGSDIRIYTQSDDGLIIEALGANISDYNLSSVWVQPSPASRGICIGDAGAVNTTARSVTEIKIQAVIHSAGNQAVQLIGGCNFQQIHISTVSQACGWDLYLAPGTSSVATSIRNCSFDIVGGSNTTGPSIATVTTANGGYGSISGNRINAMIYNPADGIQTVNLYGDYWIGDIMVDYDPNSTKSSQNTAIIIYGIESLLRTEVYNKANIGVQLASTATGNIIHLGYMNDALTDDLSIVSGATYNLLIGGSIATISNGGGSTNRLLSVRGAEQSASGSGAGYSDSGATVVHSAGTFTGNTGTSGYTVNGIVAALKAVGILAS